MAYVQPRNQALDPENEEEKKTTAAGTPAGTAAQSDKTLMPSASAGTPTAVAERPKKGSGSFTNVQRMLDANRAQASKLGDNVASNIDRQASTYEDPLEVKAMTKTADGRGQLVDEVRTDKQNIGNRMFDNALVETNQGGSRDKITAAGDRLKARSTPAPAPAPVNNQPTFGGGFVVGPSNGQPSAPSLPEGVQGLDWEWMKDARGDYQKTRITPLGTVSQAPTSGGIMIPISDQVGNKSQRWIPNGQYNPLTGAIQGGSPTPAPVAPAPVQAPAPVAPAPAPAPRPNVPAPAPVPQQQAQRVPAPAPAPINNVAPSQITPYQANVNAQLDMQARQAALGRYTNNNGRAPVAEY